MSYYEEPQAPGGPPARGIIIAALAGAAIWLALLG